MSSAGRSARTGSSPDGSSWGTAYTTLDDAVDAAAALNPTGENPVEMWIAEGTYTADPTGLTDPREATFALVDHLALYGGSGGIEGARQVIDYAGSAGDTVTLSFLAAAQRTGAPGFVGGRLFLIDAGNNRVGACVAVQLPRLDTFGPETDSCEATADAAFTQIQVEVGARGVMQGFFGFDDVALSAEHGLNGLTCRRAARPSRPGRSLSRRG